MSYVKVYVAVPTQGQVPLWVANLSSSSVTLYKGTNVDGTDAETAGYCEVPLSAQGQATRVLKR